MNKKSETAGGRSALWQGRFAESPDSEALAFETSVHIDSRMVYDDMAGSRIHAVMLARTGIISADEAESIIKSLDGIEHDLRSGSLIIDPQAEDIHSFVEQELTARIGDAGRKLHTGRSRNDQIALDERLYLRRAVFDLQGCIIRLIEVLTGIADAHRESLMSGYTHLQRAQPVSLAHHLCAWAWMLRRDFDRLDDALTRIDFCPLGSGALAGSGLPLNRAMTAQALGFSAPTPNSLDAVSDRDYCIEITAALALLMTHLSRFCEEVVIWSTEEFGFISLSEKWSTGSSIMPQKKNPDFAELIRGRTGLVYGNLMALLTMLKGLPLSYNRDMQEDKTSLFAAYDTSLSCLRIFTSMIESADWNIERMRDSCTGGHANATDLADYLVRKGMPFRTAHTVAASLVRLCLERGCSIEELPIEDLKTASPLIEEDVRPLLLPHACVAARNLIGGPASDRVRIQINELRAFCQAAAGALKEEADRIAGAMKENI